MSPVILFFSGWKVESFDSDDPIPELQHNRSFQYLTSLKRIEPTESLPVGILMEHLHRPLVGAVISMLENVNANH